MPKQPVLTPQGEDFPKWYQDVVAKAELADNGPVRGTMVIRPYAYAIWERLQAELDVRIKATGAQNAYFPLFIPESYLKREAEHVEGFSPELAVVTHGGGKELEEPVVVRPTSETIINSYFTKWVQSYRDLPLLINQWANVVRWELRPRLFLRTTEFLWQEGHTCHATEADARAYALQILRDVYEEVMVELLAIPVLTGRKTPRERFAGANESWTCEGMMGDGKALQMGTSHELGQNFAKVFGTQYLNDAGEQVPVWQTSWGVSTRLLGALIMGHGDDAGLRLPPRIAPVQAVVLLVKPEDGAGEAAAALAEELRGRNIRVQLDDRTDTSFGRRAVDWELKGAPSAGRGRPPGHWVEATWCSFAGITARRKPIALGRRRRRGRRRPRGRADGAARRGNLAAGPTHRRGHQPGRGRRCRSGRLCGHPVGNAGGGRRDTAGGAGDQCSVSA